MFVPSLCVSRLNSSWQAKSISKSTYRSEWSIEPSQHSHSSLDIRDDAGHAIVNAIRARLPFCAHVAADLPITTDAASDPSALPPVPGTRRWNVQSSIVRVIRDADGFE